VNKQKSNCNLLYVYFVADDNCCTQFFYYLQN